jgi:hypothetical protein
MRSRAASSGHRQDRQLHRSMRDDGRNLSARRTCPFLLFQRLPTLAEGSSAVRSVKAIKDRLDRKVGSEIGRKGRTRRRRYRQRRPERLVKTGRDKDKTADGEQSLERELEAHLGHVAFCVGGSVG